MPGESYGQRNLEGYSSWGHTESNMMEQLTHTHTHQRFFKKQKLELPYYPAIPFLGISLEKPLIQKDKCTPMFIAALFAIGEPWNQPK